MKTTKNVAKPQTNKDSAEKSNKKPPGPGPEPPL